MKRKAFLTHFGLLFFPVLMVCGLLAVAYSLRAHDYLTVNWVLVVVATVVIDALIAWRQTRRKSDEKPTN